MCADRILSKRLSILHQGALGDFLLALPAFEAIHRLFPAAKIDYCARQEYAHLLSERPYFGRVFSPDSAGLAPFHSDELWRNAEVPEFLSGAAAVFIFGQKGGRQMAERLSSVLQANVYWIQSFPDPKSEQAVDEFLVGQLKNFGFPVEFRRCGIDPPQRELEKAAEWLRAAGIGERRPVLVHPGSGGRKKIWPLVRWWKMLEWLRQRVDNPILLVLGEADEYLEPFAKDAQGLGVHLLRNISLLRLAAFLKKSWFYVGNDSGVSHLAAVTGTRSIVLFGTTAPEVWAPRGPEVKIIKSRWDPNENLLWPGTAEAEQLEAEVEHALIQLTSSDRSSGDVFSRG